MKYAVWAEGYCCQGMEGTPAKAQFIGYGEGDTFPEAASACIKEKWGEAYWKRFFYVMEDGTPCAFVRLFDNETDARKSFG